MQFTAWNMCEISMLSQKHKCDIMMIQNILNVAVYNYIDAFESSFVRNLQIEDFQNQEFSFVRGNISTLGLSNLNFERLNWSQVICNMMLFINDCFIPITVMASIQVLALSLNGNRFWYSLAIYLFEIYLIWFQT